MNNKNLKIGLMGGSFDPIHNGHLVLAEQVRTRFQMDKIIFIPSGCPPHKDTVVSKEHRCEMTRLAIEDNPYFDLSTIELDQENKSYTIDTVKKIKEIYGEDTEVYFITGADAIIDLPSWKDVEDLVHLCKFIGSTRPGIGDLELNNKIDSIVKNFKADITITQVPALAISSTDIRRRVKYNLSIRYLLPRSTELYIYDHCLYSDCRVMF